MAVETAARSIDLLPLTAEQTLMVNGGGTVTGFAAVQIALLRGAHVIASAGETFADCLRALGAKVTPYGQGMVERVRELVGGAPDFALHTAQVKGTLPDLVRIVDGDPSASSALRIVTRKESEFARHGRNEALFAMTCSANMHSSRPTNASRCRSPGGLPWKTGVKRRRSA
jgi:hypothetical protein